MTTAAPIGSFATPTPALRGGRSKDKDDLVAQVMAKYSLEKDQA
jgi:hypothetical protein